MKPHAEKTGTIILPFSLVLAAILVLLVQPASSAGDGFCWEFDLDSALKKAAESGKPLLISMHTSTETACVRMLDVVFQDSHVRARLKDFVVLPTCMDSHAEVVEKVNGKERPVSVLFGTVDCETLVANERAVRSRFFDSSVIKVPQHVFIDVQPDGEWRVLSRKVYELSKSRFLGLLEEALVTHGALRVGGLPGHLKDLFTRVRKESGEKREEAVKTLLNMKDTELGNLLYAVVQKIAKDKNRGECIRAMGYAELAMHANLPLRWFPDDSDHVVNCAVVTLEEMKAAIALRPLLALFPKAKSKELRKDVLRALGPCGAGNEEVRKLLVEFVDDREEIFRIASCLSLGHFLDDSGVVDLLFKRYGKEGRKTIPRTAVVWAFRHSRDPVLADAVERLVAKERNAQIRLVAEAAVKIMRGQYIEYDGQLRGALRALYAHDKIVRNEIKDWGREKNNNRGGSRGGGGRGR